MTKTTFAGLSPWAGLAAPEPKQKAEPKKPKRKESKLDALEVTDEKPKKRPAPVSKYEEKFSQLKPGQAIKCETRHVHAIANALRAWQRRKSLKWQTQTTMDYGDGFGRVFRIK